MRCWFLVQSRSCDAGLTGSVAHLLSVGLLSMIPCPHCGAANSPRVVFCAQCQTNVHWRKPPPAEPGRALTPEESMLIDKIGRAKAVLGGCVSIMAIVALFVAGTPDTPERGLFGVFIALGAALWVPMLLAPVLGILMAVQAKCTAEAQLRDLHKQEEADKV